MVQVMFPLHLMVVSLLIATCLADCTVPIYSTGSIPPSLPITSGAGGASNTLMYLIPIQINTTVTCTGVGIYPFVGSGRNGVLNMNAGLYRGQIPANWTTVNTTLTLVGQGTQKSITNFSPYSQTSSLVPIAFTFGSTFVTAGNYTIVAWYTYTGATSPDTFTFAQSDSVASFNSIDTVYNGNVNFSTSSVLPAMINTKASSYGAFFPGGVASVFVTTNVNCPFSSSTGTNAAASLLSSYALSSHVIVAAIVFAFILAL